ncbi:MAG: IPT/TIG domain-containing protein [Planctomycetota bacterium]
MNNFRTRAVNRLAVAVMCALVATATAACSGGGGGGTPTFEVTAVSPSESVDLNGGGTVVITGEQFLAAQPTTVLFGDGNPGFNLQVISDTQLEVTLPPAPNGLPVIVTVEVVSLNRGTRGLFGGFQYRGPGGTPVPPNPQTIVPTTYSPTGAQEFRITGTNLGPPGGVVTVEFGSVAAVQGQVSQDTTIVTGRAPVLGFLPVPGPLEVVVRNGSFAEAVPTQVRFEKPDTVALGVPRQSVTAQINSSVPVRINSGVAAMITTGTDFIWGNGNDEMVLVYGPPSTTSVVNALSLGTAAPRSLSPNYSLPVRVDNDTVVLSGPGATPANTVLYIVSNLAAATPTVTVANVPNLAPIMPARIADGQLGVILQGTGLGGADQLQVLTFTGGQITGQLATAIDIGTADVISATGRGRANVSRPASPDGDSVFVVGLGANGVFGDADDTLIRYRISTTEIAGIVAPHFVAPPIFVSASRVVGVAAAIIQAPDPDDALVVYDVLGTAISQTIIDLDSRADVGAARTIVTFGDGNVAVATGGVDRAPNNADDLVAVYRASTVAPPFDGPTQFSFGRRPVMAPLGNGFLLVSARGLDGTANSSDDVQVTITPEGNALRAFQSSLTWPQHRVPSVQDGRAFALRRGPDSLWSTADEELVVFQSEALGSPPDGLAFRIGGGAAALISGFEPFVPIGANWGLIQSPGLGGFGTAADLILFVFY